ncbi:MAG: yicI [Chloroflexi bacterium]|nr:yicI [Chloroflexota bacterium]
MIDRNGQAGEPELRADGLALVIRAGRERLRVEPWGPDGIRVRAALGPIRDDLLGAILLPPPPSPGTRLTFTEGRATLTNGRLALVASRDARVVPMHGPTVHLSFARADTGAALLAEERTAPAWPGPRRWRARGQLPALEVSFAAEPRERRYGLGQHQHGALDHAGHVLELAQRNMNVSVPFLLSSRGYGFLWNNPAVGRVELTGQRTRWVAEATAQLDYWVVAGDTPRAIVEAYAAVAGRPAPLPDWALGFWQSTLRYPSQAALLAAAREHVTGRGLPLAVIVLDALHWPRFGDWTFDPVDWPDPEAMTAELSALGVRLMVSVWPHVNPASDAYGPLADGGLLVGAATGGTALATFIDSGSEDPVRLALVDATNPAARAAMWAGLRRGYVDRGVAALWLDGCEPEIIPLEPEELVFAAGPGLAVANLYPREHARMVAEGMRAAGREFVTLVRSAWAGSQRHGIVLWSGDVTSTWEAFRAQVPAGLNAGLAGIPWWTTDIGGFIGGEPEDPGFRELLVRWFQYGAFCPIFRLHGYRSPGSGIGGPGGPNQVWSFGPDAYAILIEHLRLRERLRPYLALQAGQAADTGLPPMRPCFVDFPGDPAAWDPVDQYLLGPDLLVAPVTSPGATARTVYLPAGAAWVERATGRRLEGGQTVEAAAPLEHLPLFLRAGVADPFGG